MQCEGQCLLVCIGTCSLLIFLINLVIIPWIAGGMYIYAIKKYDAWGTPLGTWMLVYIVANILWVPMAFTKKY